MPQLFCGELAFRPFNSTALERAVVGKPPHFPDRGLFRLRLVLAAYNLVDLLPAAVRFGRALAAAFSPCSILSFY